MNHYIKGRPKKKNGKRVNFYLSENCIDKLNKLTIVSRNKSAFVEGLINKKYLEVKKQPNSNG